MSSSSSSNLHALNSVNSEYIAHLYSQYLEAPGSVNKSWQIFFSGLNDEESSLLKELHGPSWTPDENRKSANAFGRLDSAANDLLKKTAVQSQNHAPDADVKKATLDSLRALMLIRAYRVRGHLIADLDPLDLKEKEEHPELRPEHYGFTDADFDHPIFLNHVLGLEYATLREVLVALKETYSKTIGVEFMHMSDPEEKAWIQERIEGIHNQTDFTANGRKAILERLTAAEMFETYLHTKYPGTKRFGLDGGESLIPAIEQIMKRGGQLGMKEIVLGMAHRGRLNVLTNIMGKSFTAVFSEFRGTPSQPDSVLGSGDVKYHLGTSGDRDFDGNVIHLSLNANPSHLEAVNPVVIGKVRAKQIQRGDAENDQVMPMLLHGDAAFAGQGIVAETLMISELPGYSVGGTIHIVINNQIGFTTTPKFGRSGPYCTDVAKMLSAPIFHVNGDDPEAVVHVSRIAIEFRQRFKKDVVIDMFCYRRNGHNEGDEPMFTQPKMYKKIAEHKTTKTLYGQKLVDNNVLLESDVEEIEKKFRATLDEAYEASETYKPNKANYLEGFWSDMEVAPEDEDIRKGKTAISNDMFNKVGTALSALPQSFTPHKKIDRMLDGRAKMVNGAAGFDWGTGEAMAFGTLLAEGYDVRLSGQDVGRGTFSHRHAILYDQEKDQTYMPLRHVGEDQGFIEVHDSPLSEAAVLGFEYGYTLADPKALVLWEAQFGDFVNGAQIHIDQFISTGELKWLRMSGLVMLLPHGYEGQGPEHSSARLERFLQACAEDNWQVCNCTTPAQYFHVLRRQMHRNFRKPLVIMTPKSLLRHKLAVSTIDDFTGDSSFHRFLWDDDRDNLVAPDKIKRIVLCSGKVYYDLYKEREERGLKDIVLLRLEQLYPFPQNALAEELKQYENADIIWCQEEPKNMGAWHFITERIEKSLGIAEHKAGRAQYVGRPPAASPATGSLAKHASQQSKLVNEALTVEK